MNVLLKNLKALFIELTDSVPSSILIDEDGTEIQLAVRSGKEQLFFVIRDNVCYLDTTGFHLSESQEEKYGVKNAKE